MTYPEFLARWNDPTDEKLSALHSVKAIRALTGLSQVAFATAFGIPKKTIEGWESNGSVHRDCPPYTLALLVYAVIKNG